jgi:ABC-type glutathione transport system ATPase component
MMGSFVVLTGASGGGKTTIARAIEDTHPEFSVFRFDTIGVPSVEIMDTFGTGHQPGGAWQHAMTLQWFERIAPVLQSGRSVLFEGQMRIAFIQEALVVHQISHAHVILVECDDQTRTARLTHDRQQPELANDSMTGWSLYLHQEAVEAGYEIFDTGLVPLSESVERIVSYLYEKHDSGTVI